MVTTAPAPDPPSKSTRGGIVKTKLIVAAVGVAVAAALASSTAASDTRARPVAPTAVLEWNAVAQDAVVVGAAKSPHDSFVYLAYVQAAVYDAVVSIQGGYEPYAVSVRAPKGASPEAAAATAAHDTLAALLPAQRASLDAALATSLGRIPDGAAERNGAAVGRAVAAGLLALRADDGRDAPIGYTPGSGPGKWQPTPPAFAPGASPWLAVLRPFVLDSPAQFRPSAPPALDSAAWRRDDAEVKLYGSATSAVRTPAQTETARFWSANPAGQYNASVRAVASARHLDIVQAARLLAMTDTIISDALVGCWDAKYTYGFWRPVTAIRATEDPTWTPLLVTPNHPEYPSAHSCVTAALTEVLTTFLGTREIDLDVASSATGTTRHFDRGADLKRELGNARVWAGLHYRFSTVVGLDLGAKIARYDLRHAFGERRS
jgi:hypothetical protein